MTFAGSQIWSRGWRLLHTVRWWLTSLVVLVLLSAGPGHAGGSEDAPSPAAPRVSVEIGGVGVVLVYADARLAAFVDRLDDNAPAGDAELTVSRVDGGRVAFGRAGAGLFVAPHILTGQTRESFDIAVRSTDGTGTMRAVLVYQNAAEALPTLGRSLPIFSLPSLLLAAVAMAALLAQSFRVSRRRALPAGGRG